MRGMLSSEALERQFGKTKLKLLRQDEDCRIIATIAASSGKYLELSRVVFRPEGTEAFPEVHRSILAGASMGKAFAEAGIAFRRDIHASGQYDSRTVPAIFVRRFGTDGQPTVTSLTVMVGPASAPYAEILEIYSPLVQPWELTARRINTGIGARLKSFSDELATLGDTA